MEHARCPRFVRQPSTTTELEHNLNCLRTFRISGIAKQIARKTKFGRHMNKKLSEMAGSWRRANRDGHVTLPTLAPTDPSSSSRASADAVIWVDQRATFSMIPYQDARQNIRQIYDYRHRNNCEQRTRLGYENVDRDARKRQMDQRYLTRRSRVRSRRAKNQFGVAMAAKRRHFIGRFTAVLAADARYTTRFGAWIATIISVLSGHWAELCRIKER